MAALRAGLLYWAVVFAAGFVLGTIRVLWIVPRLGTRTAELLETPLMLAISGAAARWIIRRLGVPSRWTERLTMGAGALGLLLAAEFTIVLRVRGVSLEQYVGALDPVAGTVYYVSLMVFGLMPLLVQRKEQSEQARD